jgi:hypothetical protein
MPLGKSVSQNVRELMKKNKAYAKPGGKNPRSKKQVLAIAISASKRPKKK